MNRFWTNFACLLLIFSQISIVMGFAGEMSWCIHADGQVSLETIADQQDCHISQQDASEEKNCKDIPAEPANTFLSRAELHRNTVVIHQIAIQLLQFFPWNYDLIQVAQPAVTYSIDVNRSTDDQVLGCLATVVLLT